MQCKRLPKYAFLLVVAAACSRENPAPPEEQPTTTASAPTITSVATAPSSTRYDDAVRWFRSTPGFHFILEEGGVRAEGDMTRSTVGAEEVRVTVNAEEWIAKAGAKGVVWERGGKEVAPPEWGNRVFQRVTIAFDPEKSEREAQLIEPKHFRFTDANSGSIHDVHVNDAGQIARITIGGAVTMTLSRQR
jgi:hypothetical protein